MSNSEEARKPEIDLFDDSLPNPFHVMPPIGAINPRGPMKDFEPVLPVQTTVKFGAEGWAAEEARRLQESAGLNESLIEVPSGTLVRVDQGPGDFLVMVTSFGKQIAIHRVTALQRAKGVLDMCLAETGGADPAVMDRDIEMVHMMFKAVILNARNNGKMYNSQSIKKFEQMLSKASKAYKGRSESTSAAQNVNKAYNG